MEDRAATKRHMRQRPNYISIVIFITVIVFALLGAYHLLCVHFSEDLLLQKARDVASRSLEEAAASDGTDLSDFSLGDPALEATVSVFDADGALIVSRTYTSDKDAPLYPIWPDESVVSQAREQAPGSFLQTIPLPRSHAFHRSGKRAERPVDLRHPLPTVFPASYRL